MRKFVSIFAMLILAAFFNIAYAQGYTFRVLANKGQNKVIKAGKRTPDPLKTGARLNANDELIASKGAYIGLMHRTGKTLEVRTPGTKKVADLEKMVNTKATSVASRYAKFLAKKMNEKEAPGYRSRLNATGAVSRALTGEETIQVLLPAADNSFMVGNNAIISWDTPEGMEVNEFIVTVKNIFDEEIMKKEVKGNSANLDFTSDAMKNEEEETLYIVTVAAKEKTSVTSGNIGLKRLSGEAAAEYAKGLSSLKQDMPEEETSLSKVVYASFYEDNGLIIDALTKLEEAAKLSPEVEDFKTMRKDLIERSRIKIYKEESEKK